MDNGGYDQLGIPHTGSIDNVPSGIGGGPLDDGRMKEEDATKDQSGVKKPSDKTPKSSDKSAAPTPGKSSTGKAGTTGSGGTGNTGTTGTTGTTGAPGGATGGGTGK